MIAIQNAKIVLEHSILEDGVLLVDGDTILDFGKQNEVSIPDGAKVYDAKGLYVGPGFVDIHVHGGNGEFFENNPLVAAEHFLSHGETTVLATLYYSLDQKQFVEAIETVKAAMAKGGACKAIAGFYMEGPYMNPKYGASPELNKWRGPIDETAYTPLLNAAGSLAKVWAIAPERDGILGFMQKAKEANPDTVFSVGHSEATPPQVRAAKPYGIGLQTHCMNATGRPDCPGGTRSCGPDEACLIDPDIYAELICDSLGIHVSSEMLRFVIAVKGMDKVVLISDSYVSDEPTPPELAHVTDLQFDANGGLCGSKLTLDKACRNIMNHIGCSINDAFIMASRNPARAIGMGDEIGTIAKGKKANLVFVDGEFNVEQVMLEGLFCK